SSRLSRCLRLLPYPRSCCATLRWQNWRVSSTIRQHHIRRRERDHCGASSGDCLQTQVDFKRGFRSLLCLIAGDAGYEPVGVRDGCRLDCSRLVGCARFAAIAVFAFALAITNKVDSLWIVLSAAVITMLPGTGV